MILRFLQASEGGMGGCPLRPRRRWLTLPLWCPAGGLAFFVACCPPAFTFFFAPYPPDRARRALFPGGEGGVF